MPRQAQNSLTVTAIAKNEMSAALAAAGNDVKKMGEVIAQAETTAIARSQAAMKAETARLQVIRSMPEQFSKASAALGVFGAANTDIGQAVTAAGGKLSGIAALIATGGPFGVAIAAAGAAVAAGASVWGVYKLEAANVEAGLRSLSGVMDAMQERLLAHRDRVKELNEQVRFFGLTQEQVQIIKAKEAAETANKGSAAIAAEVAQRRTAVETIELQIAALEKNNFGQEREDRQNLATALSLRAKVDEERQYISTLEASVQAAREHEALAKEQIASTRKLIGLRREHTEALKDEHAALPPIAKIFDDIDAAMFKTSNDAEEMARRLGPELAESVKRGMISIQEDLGVLGITAQSVASSVGDAFTTEFDAMAEGAEFSGHAISKAIVDSAIRSVQAYIVSAQAAVFFSQAGIPVVGPILGTIAAAAAGAFLKKLINEIPKSHMGERIPRGSGEQLRVVRGGETIVSERETIQGGGGGSTVNQFNITAPIGNPNEMTQEQMDRWLLRALKRVPVLQRDGLLRFDG